MPSNKRKAKNNEPEPVAKANIPPKKKAKNSNQKSVLQTENEMPVAAAITSSTSSAKAAKRAKSSEKSKQNLASENEIPEAVKKELGESDVENEANGEAELAEWSKEEYKELFGRIEKALPKNDTMKYDSRVNHLDWSSVSFNGHTADDCKKRWTFVQNHLRRYRIVAELLNDAKDWLDHPWFNFNKGSKTQQRHPDMPKKPLSSYMLFFMEVRDQVRSEHPDLDMPRLSKHIGAMYNELTEKKKMKYAELAKKEKDEYEKKMQKFMEDHPEHVPTKAEKNILAGTSKLTPPAAPTPFRLYCQEEQEKFQREEGLSKLEAMEKCRSTWKALPEKSKLKWITAALEQEASYKEELEKFIAENPSANVAAYRGLLSKDELALKAKALGKPEKPPNSGYSLFSKEMLGSEALRHLQSKDRMTEISRMWKDLAESERARYNERTRQMIHDYKLEFASYLDSLPAEERDAELKAALPKKSQQKASNEEVSTKSPTKKNKQKAEDLYTDSEEDDKAGDSTEESDDSESSDQESVTPEKNTNGKHITKPVSALEMYCRENLAKYRKKSPGSTDEELRRAMAKAYSKLGTSQKEKYQKMADKTKSEKVAAPKSKSPAKPKASATRKTAAISRAAKKETVKSTVESKSTPKRTAKASENLNHENLFKNEPEKPPTSIEDFYGKIICKGKVTDKDDIHKKWRNLSQSQQEKHKRKYSQLKVEYLDKLKDFLRGLSEEDMSQYKKIFEARNKRAASESADLEDTRQESDEEEDEESSNSDESSESS